MLDLLPTINPTLDEMVEESGASVLPTAEAVPKTKPTHQPTQQKQRPITKFW